MTIFQKQVLYGPHYKWILVGLLFVSGFLNLEDRVVIFSIIPLMRRDLHLTDLQTGALMTTFLWTYAAFSPFSGYFGDRLSRRRVLIASVCAWSVVTIFAGLITSTGQLFTTRVLLGFTESFYLPTAMAMLADWHTRSTRGKAVSILTLGANLGPILGGTFAGYVGDHYGWRMVLYVLGVIGVAHSLVLTGLLREARQGASEGSDEPQPTQRLPFGYVLGTLLSIPSFLCLGLVSGINALAVFMLNTWLPVFLYDHFKVNLTQSAFLGNTAIMGPMMVGVFVGGILSDVFGGKQPKYRFLFFAVAMAFAIPWPLLFWWAGNLTVVLTGVALFGLFRSLGECNWHPVMYELVTPRMRSTATGISNSFNCMMGGVGALVGGYFKSTLGLQRVFGLVSVLLTVSVASLFFTYFVFLPRDLKRAEAVRQQRSTTSIPG